MTIHNRKKMIIGTFIIIGIILSLLAGCGGSTSPAAPAPVSSPAPAGQQATPHVGLTTVPTATPSPKPTGGQATQSQQEPQPKAPPTTPGLQVDARVSVVPSVETVSPGQNFDVFIRVSTNVPSRGVQCTLNWDPTKARCNSVEEGGFYREFAASHGFSSDPWPVPLEADNTLGQFPPGKDPLGLRFYAASICMMGGRAPDGTLLAPVGSGDIFILHMTALEGASGTIEFTLSNVVLNDASPVAQELDCKVINGRVTVK